MVSSFFLAVLRIFSFFQRSFVTDSNLIDLKQTFKKMQSFAGVL